MNGYFSNLNEYLSNSAEKYGEKIAIYSARVPHSYMDIYQKVTSLANFLLTKNIRKGDRVVISLGNELEAVIGFWAVLKIGGVISLINSNLPINKITYIINDSGAKLLICSSVIYQQLNELNLLDSKKFNCILREDFDNYINNKVALEFKNNVLDIDLASIIYTSGSTGEPKGVVMNHRNMLSASTSIIKYLQYNESDKIICALPISFDYGLYQMIMAFAVGATIILEKDFVLPLQYLKNIEKYQVTVAPLVPSMVSILLNFNIKFKYDLSSVKSITNTGAALNLKHIKEIETIFCNAKIFSMYGLTECKRCTYLPPEYLNKKPNSVGIAIPNTELWIVDEHDKKLEPNQIGQLVIRGSTVMQGYWNKPEQTQAKLKKYNLTNENIFYTGDLCYLDEDGFLYFHGRMDEVIKSRGVKVSPKEIEDVIGAMDMISEVAVIGLDHNQYGEMICAVVATSQKLNELEVINFCKTKLEHEKIPQQIIFLNHLPKSANGKIDKTVIKLQVNTMMVNGLTKETCA